MLMLKSKSEPQREMKRYSTDERREHHDNKGPDTWLINVNFPQWRPCSGADLRDNASWHVGKVT